MNFPFQLPPEILQQLRQQHELEHMERDEAIHAYRDFLYSLSEDQLQLLRGLLRACQDEETSGQWQGRIIEILHLKHNVCPCGIDHDRAAEEMLEGETETKGPQSEVEAKLMSSTREELIEEYGLERVDLDTEYPYLRCKGCETVVQSLEDRMLRPPGIKGCETCQHKAKWG